MIKEKEVEKANELQEALDGGGRYIEIYIVLKN